MKTAPVVILGFLATLSLAGAAHADLIPTGQTRLEYSAAIDNLDEHPEYVFVLYPYSFSNENSNEIGFLVAGKDRITFGRFADSKLYAIKKADFDLPTIEAMKSGALAEFFASEKVYVAQLSLPAQSFVKLEEPYRKMHDVIRIGGIVGMTLSANFTRTIYTNEDGSSKELRWFGTERPPYDTKVLPPAETPEPVKGEEPDGPSPKLAPKGASKCAAFGGEAWALLGLALWLVRRR